MDKQEQKEIVKKFKIKMRIGLIAIVVVGLAIAVYFVFINPIERGDEIVTNNSNITKNINNAPSCSALLEEDCRARADCLTVDICQPVTDGYKADKCNTEVTPESCVTAGFDHCEDVICDKIEGIKFPDTDVDITCSDNEDCIIVDVTESVGDCCSMPDCRNWYTDDKYVAVNSKSYYNQALEYKDNNCSNIACEEVPNPYCPPRVPFAEADCQDDICMKVTHGTEYLDTYNNIENGYYLKIPAGYEKNTESSGYLALDVSTASSATLTFNRIIVTVEDTDMHTYRLSILTDQSANTDNMTEEERTVSGIPANKMILKNALGETIIHYLVSYLGKVYDIETTDSVSQETIDTFVANFEITQLDKDIDIADTSVFENKTCVSNNECGAYPCDQGMCLIKECISDEECSAGTCGQYVTPVPGYCTTIDSL